MEKRSAGKRQLSLTPLTTLTAFLAAAMVVATVSSEAAAGKDAPLFSEQQIAAYCGNSKHPTHRLACERYYRAQPYTFTVKTLPPGDGYTLCERFADNLRALVEPPTCELKIHPRYADLFQVVEWEQLDPKEHPDLLYYASMVTSIPGEMALRYGGASWPTREAWRQEFEKRLAAEGAEEGAVHVDLARAYFDANSDGQPEWVLGYRWRRPCNPWGTTTSHSDGYYSYFLLQAERLAIDRKAMGTDLSILGIGWDTYPFTTTISDPRNPETRTYLLDGGFGSVSRHAGKGVIPGGGHTFHMYAARYWGMGQVAAHHVCTFELRKQPPTKK